MRLADLTKAVKISPEKLAKLIGVARQSLYLEETNMSPKVRCAVLTLYDLNDNRLKEEVCQAEERWQVSANAIDDFVRKMNEGGEDDG